MARGLAGRTRGVPARLRLLPACSEIMLAVGALPEARDACHEPEETAECVGTDVLSAQAAHARGA
jgi:hypothetical protein